METWFAEGAAVLVTGGRGFLGSHICLRLAALAPAGCEVISLDNGTRDAFTALGQPAPVNLRFVDGDLLEPEQWLGELGRPSVVVHCAALAGVSTYYRKPTEVLRVNGLGSARLFEALAALDPGLVVNLSTSEVYGPHAEGVAEGDLTPIGPISDPRWAYAASKIFAEHLLFAMAREHGLSVLSLRPFNVYGPGQVGEGAVRNFCERAAAGQALRVTGDGSPSRAWLYVDDFVDALFALVAVPSAWGRAYNVGAPDSRVSTLELAELINKLAGNEAGVEFEPHPGQDVVHRWPRIDALTTATGWRPRVGLEDGLRRTVGFWQQ
ncbi:MAG: hypothetical protein CMP23_16845 [Rickettsiales bacterium]|nr:hypothetical protein [Rickettsiales bacterium]